MDVEFEEKRKKVVDKIQATQEELEKRRRERDAKIAQLERECLEIEKKKVQLSTERSKVKMQLERDLEGVEAKLQEMDKERERLLERERAAKAVSPRNLHVVEGLEEELGEMGEAAANGQDEFF
jgi:chromosome segregation ATPase